MGVTTRGTADGTRQALLRAAEELFAEQGVDGARTRDITERAGQANSSALHYHFGSRDGLLKVIIARHQERVEEALTAGLEASGATDLTALVTAYVEAEASELAHDSGRHCLRIVSQLAHETGFRDGHAHEALAGGALWDTFTHIAARLTHLPDPIANERVELMVMLVGAAFADRARHVGAGRPRPVEGEAFRADLVRVVVGMLTAPGP
ncbi:TetR/AcrR family transcriptional regulator [Yinghuangia seranimata]|uniref:TetR/AcrR family transcriptional regulator n=1 Tax=Yinghuangia seranimata TaxID=408067 RepID=UPI00248B287E|nr:TetR/AcrR family transcriptional regulator [Yinghuangia seranimata]MDI2131961.1 TetR family transcriptional regulator [Yinghuangia seranimata]